MTTYPRVNMSKEVDNMRCPYCGGKVRIRQASYVYHTSKYKGNLLVCENYPRCDSYVSCHQNTTVPKGRLANKRLRTLKSKAHSYFDPLWINKTFSSEHSKNYNRTKAYEWLADKLDIPVSKCHIGMFDEDTCKRVVKLCEKKMIEVGISQPYEPVTSRGYRKS